MTAINGIIFAVASGAMIAAAACELAMADLAIPRRRLRSWSMWGGVGATLTGIVAASTHHGLDAALLSSLAVGLVCQPLGQTLLARRTAGGARTPESGSRWPPPRLQRDGGVLDLAAAYGP